MKKRILLTGAASLVGAEILRALILRDDIESLQLLLPRDETQGRMVYDRLESYLGSMPRWVGTMNAEMRLPRFGMQPTEWDRLAFSFDLGFHCAQREVQDHRIDLSRQANVRPMEDWLQLLSRNPEMCLHHLSTAFVGGTRQGLYTEFDLDCGQSLHHAWELSKYEAEVRLRSSRVSDRVTIYRPAHVLGSTTTGAAFDHKGGYPLLATLAAATVLPADSHARLDFVPADFVANAMVTLAFSGSSGTFHLASGWEHSFTVRQLATLAAKGSGRSHPAVLLPRGIAWPLASIGTGSAGNLSSRQYSYEIAHDLLHQGPVMDTFRAQKALEHTSIACPPPETWLDKSLQEANARKWAAPPIDEFENLIEVATLPSAAAEFSLIQREAVFCEKTYQRVGDVNVAYRDIGKGEPVVLLHGIAGAHSWDGVAQRLAAKRRVLVVETLGLGDSSGKTLADYKLTSQAAHVRGLLSMLDISSAHIVGNGIGATIAEIFTVRWPACARTLVLSNCDNSASWTYRKLPKLAALLRIPGGALLISALLRNLTIARSSWGLGNLVYDRRLLTHERISLLVEALVGSRERRAKLSTLLRSLRTTDLALLDHQLAELELPAMIVWGAEDKSHSCSVAKQLFDLIPGAHSLELIPYAGASCQEERPDHFAKLLGRFFDKFEMEDSYPVSKSTITSKGSEESTRATVQML